MVLEPAPAVIVAGAAATVDCVALGPPAVAEAVNVTGLPVSPDDVARSVSVLAAVPSVQELAAATPLALVITAVAGTAGPVSPPDGKVSSPPRPALANRSRRIPDGGGADA